MIGWLDIPQVCKLIACCAAADDVDGDGDDDCRISGERKIRKHWLALFVSHPLACLAVQKAQEGKSRRVRVQVIISQWAISVLTMIITGEKGRTRFKIRREEKAK